MKQESQNVEKIQNMREKSQRKCSFFFAFLTSNTSSANQIVVVKVNVLPNMPKTISY